MNSPEEMAALIEYNTAEFFLELGHLNNDEICDISKIKYIFSKNWQSRIFMANFRESNATKNINQIISRTKELNIPVLWFVTPMNHPQNLQNILKDSGFIYQNDWRGMAIDLETVPEKFNVPEDMGIKEVLNLKELKIWTDVLVESFQFPKLITSYKKYFIKAGLNNLNFCYYLGFFKEKPVATSIFFKGKEAAGIFYIGTVPHARGKGIAESMVRHILNEAKNHSYNICALQASELGYPLYKKIGFKKYFVTNIHKLNRSIQ